jgi:glycerol uptake facilitator-like aquaporin
MVETSRLVTIAVLLAVNVWVPFRGVVVGSHLNPAFTVRRNTAWEWGKCYVMY